MQYNRTTGGFPWIPQVPADFDQSPYQYPEGHALLERLAALRRLTDDA